MMLQNRGWKKTFFIIAFGQAVSLIGSSAVQFALIWWLAERTSSPVMMGLAGIVAFLPMTFLSPFAGVAADRYNRKAISIISDMSMGILALLYAAVLYFMDIPIWTVLAVLCARGVGNTFQQPAIQSIIPQLVPSEQLIKANGWTQLMTSGSFILGPVIGAALYAAAPMYVILLTDVIGAAFASGALALVKVPRLQHKETEKAGFLTQFKEGIGVYRGDRKLFMLVTAQALCMFFFAPLSTFYPLMTSSFFKLSAFHGSVVEMGFAAGMMVTALLFGSVLKVKHKIGVSYAGLFGIGITSAVCGLVPPVFTGWIIFTVTCSFMGAFGNVHTIPMTAYMQETIAPEKMGRAFSLLGLIGSLAMPAGLLVGSPIAEKIGVHAWFFISGVGILLITGVIVGINWIRRL
ncbi:MFS transporter [Qiania dongpingensis]|nr:MFS transporter [Qiania dongpingensis]